MTITRTALAAIVVAVALLAAPGAAPAADRDEIIADCADDGRLDGNYSKSELRDARKNLPSDVAEYTDCSDVLRRAELPDRGGDGGGGAAGGGGPGAAPDGTGGGELLTPASDAERSALAEAARGTPDAVEVDGSSVVPGVSGLGPNAARNGIPAPLLAALIAIALLGALAGAPALQRRLSWQRLTRRSAPS